MSHCGGYSEFKEGDQKSSQVLKSVENQLASHPQLNNLSFKDITDNHSYAHQVVAGMNYKFKFEHEGCPYEATVWHKLDNTYHLTNVQTN